MAPPTRSRSSTDRGRQRREALVQAAADLLVEQGPAAVTARAVASGAGAPLSLVPYYFADVGEMVRAASTQVLEGHLVAARSHLDGVNGRTSRRDLGRRLVAMVLGPYAGLGPTGLAALYSRALAAAADPAWAHEVRGWDEQFPPLVAELLRAAGRDDARARTLLACTDGWAVSAALRGLERAEAVIAAEVASVIDLLAPPVTIPRPQKA